MSNAPDPNKGYLVSGETLTRILDGLTRRITGGRGINVRRYGQQVIIESTIKRNHIPPPAVPTGTGAVLAFENYAAMADVVSVTPAGTLGITADKGNLYIRDLDGWRILHPYRGTSEPTDLGARDGDHWYNTTTDVLYVRLEGEWVPESHFAEPEEEEEEE